MIWNVAPEAIPGIDVGVLVPIAEQVENFRMALCGAVHGKAPQSLIIAHASGGSYR
jgi:hypothetical protein